MCVVLKLGSTHWEMYEQFCDFEGFAWYVLSHMRPFLFGCHISFCCFFALEVVRGHYFWTHLKMCVVIFDLLPPILGS